MSPLSRGVIGMIVAVTGWAAASCNAGGSGSTAPAASAAPSVSATPTSSPTPSPTATATVRPGSGDASLLRERDLPPAGQGLSWSPANPADAADLTVCGTRIALPEGRLGSTAWTAQETSGDRLPGASANDFVVTGIGQRAVQSFRTSLIEAVDDCRIDEEALSQGMPAASARTLFSQPAGVIVENGEVYTLGVDQIPRWYVVFSGSERSLHVTTYGTADAARSFLPAALALLRAQTR